MNNVEIRDNKITGDLKPFDFDYKGAGYTALNAPGGYMALSLPTGFVNVEFKEGRFRVTITKIILS